jgi:hypothetical protein
VIVSFEANEDPQRWGYGALGLAWPTELAHGLPVFRARTECSLDGYAAVMGWVQIVRIDRESFPVLGLRWGYSTRTGQPHELHEPAQLDESHWAKALPLLRKTFPDWQFRSE